MAFLPLLTSVLFSLCVSRTGDIRAGQSSRFHASCRFSADSALILSGSFVGLSRSGLQAGLALCADSDIALAHHVSEDGLVVRSGRSRNWMNSLQNGSIVALVKSSH